MLPFFAWRFGGSVELTRATCRELARRGHDVRVLTTDLGDSGAPTGEWVDGDGYRVLRVRSGSLHGLPPYLPPRELLRALDRELLCADVVTSPVGLTLLAAAVSKRCARARVPYVHAVQGALEPARLRHKGWRKTLFLLACERPLLRRATALHALTAKEALDLQRHGAPPERIFVVPNGVDPDAWCDGDRERVRRTWGIGRHAEVVLFVGRLAPEKGLELALAAAAPLLRQQRHLWFVAAGPDGGSARALRRLAALHGVADRVLLPGPIAPSARADVFAAGDVFACTSWGEGVPIAVLEAASAGLPLWLTRGCNLPEVAEFGAGTIDPPDADELRVSLTSLVDHANHRRQCAANARRMVRARFSLESVADRLEAVYAEIAR